MFIKIFIIFYSNNLIAAPIEIKPRSNRSVLVQDKVATKKSSIKRNSGVNRKEVVRDESISEEMQEVKNLDNANNLLIKKFLNKNTVAMWDFTNQYDVKTGTAIKGVLLNSIVTSNLESPLLVETTESFEGIPQGSKFSCIGISKNKRVLTACDRLITDDEEYEVDTILLNPDGTAGLLGKAYSGKEQYAVGAITAATLKSALGVGLDSVTNISGTETVLNTSKNKIKAGGMGALDEIIQMNADEYKTQEPKISIDAGKNILIYFKRRFKI